MNELETVPTDQNETPESEVKMTEEKSDDSAPHLVPVSEAKKYRKRAQAAEKILEDMKEELSSKDALLKEHEKTIGTLERSRRIDELLLEADTIDLEAARLLTEMAVLDMEDQDVELAVEELRRQKPYLFHRRSRLAGVLSPHSGMGESSHNDSLRHAVAEACATGSRADLLRYLRLKRQG